MDFLRAQHGPGAKVRRDVNAKVAGRLAPAQPQCQDDETLHADHPPQGTHMGAHVIDFEPVAAHGPSSRGPRCRFAAPRVRGTGQARAGGYETPAGNNPPGDCA